VFFALQAFDTANIKLTKDSTIPQIERAFAKGMKNASLVEGREAALSDARAILVRAAGGEA
jgi:hypothetical protein